MLGIHGSQSRGNGCDLLQLCTGQIVPLPCRQRVVGFLRGLGGLPLRSGQPIRIGQRIDLCPDIVNGAEALDRILQLLQLLQLRCIDLGLLILAQGIKSAARCGGSPGDLLIACVGHGGGLGQLGDQPCHIVRAGVGIEQPQHIPCAVILLRVALLIVHGGPLPCAAADIDRVARLHGDALRAFIEAEALGVACDLLVEEYQVSLTLI